MKADMKGRGGGNRATWGGHYRAERQKRWREEEIVDQLKLDEIRQVQTQFQPVVPLMCVSILCSFPPLLL